MFGKSKQAMAQSLAEKINKEFVQRKPLGEDISKFCKDMCTLKPEKCDNCPLFKYHPSSGEVKNG